MLVTFRHFTVVAEHDRIELVHTALHHLHANPDVAFAEKCAIKVNRERAVARTHRNIEIHQESFL